MPLKGVLCEIQGCAMLLSTGNSFSINSVIWEKIKDPKLSRAPGPSDTELFWPKGEHWLINMILKHLISTTWFNSQ